MVVNKDWDSPQKYLKIMNIYIIADWIERLSYSYTF